MHHTCVARFDVIENLEIFWKLNKASAGFGDQNTSNRSQNKRQRFQNVLIIKQLQNAPYDK